MRALSWLVLLGLIAAACTSGASDADGLGESPADEAGATVSVPSTAQGMIVPDEPPDIRVPAVWGTGRATPPPGEFLDVAVAAGVSCGVRADTVLVCWGEESWVPPAGESGFSAVRLTGYGSYWRRGHGCALRTDGRLLCWDDEARPVQVPGGAFVDAAVGRSHWCGHRADGRVVCGGRGVDGHVLLEGGGYEQVAVDQVVCALAVGGEARCGDPDWWGRGMSFGVSEGRSWGREASLGALHGLLRGDGRWSVVSVSPYAVASAPPVPQLSGGVVSPLLSGPDGARSRSVPAEACGIDTDGRLECWGVHGSWTVPTGRFADVAVGARHACALGADGAAVCWGASESGQTDAPEGPFSDVWVLDSGSCGLHIDRRFVCWGDPGVGFDPAAGPFVDVAAGHLHACGLREDGSVVCWPTLDEQTIVADAARLHENDHRLDGLRQKHLGLADVGLFEPPEGPFSQIASGQFFACGLHVEGAVQCWGALSGAQGSGLDSLIEGRRFVQIAAAGDVVCALDEDGIMGCKAHDCRFESHGEAACGLGTVRFPGPRDGRFAAATALARFGLMCGLRTDRSLECAGEHVEWNAPSWVGPLSAINVSESTVCGTRTSDGSIACWIPPGHENVTPQHWVGVPYLGVSDVCALRANGAIRCLYSDAILGFFEGYQYRRQELIDDPPQGEFVKIAVSRDHGCALRVDRTVICWGSDGHG